MEDAAVEANHSLSPISGFSLSRFLTSFFTPLIKRKENSYSITGIPSFLEELSQLNPAHELIMCSFDVVSLYLSLPHQLIIESVTEFLIDLNTDITIINKIEKLCRLCLDLNVFSFDGQWFQQIRGSPMGSPLSTVVAELVMSRLDRWINLQHASDLIFWRRYIDDIFCICSKDKVKNILDTLNKSENNNVLPFLDILIIRTPNKYHTTVFYKKHMNPSYTHYTSFCPISHKITVVKTLTKRIFTHCSLPCFKTIEQTNITNHLTALGYPISFIHRHSFNPNFSRQPKTYRTHCTIPYSKVNTTIAHKLNKYGISTYFSTHANLGSLLRNPITKILVPIPYLNLMQYTLSNLVIVELSVTLQLRDLFQQLNDETILRPLYKRGMDIDNVVLAVLYPNLREHFLAELSPEHKIILVKFLNTVTEHARDKDSITHNGLSELKVALSS
ncbi:hypothetical protein LAZ67_X000907 [Cordylochernes scorpioides]|uniref:Reverse transcriptase domain-containing protein n=1 Tax=Cordylochernes scorpioides TaxID=51811 RepID=A0ABY6LW31_9ARAC|nr:hypothetical protein LAZ67_X000907 [Cordylochernes scorpioides]